MTDTDGIRSPGADGEALWHLTERSSWERALATGRYDGSTRGASLAEVGFVHCSYPGQLAAVAGFVFAGCEEELVVLELDRALLEEAGSLVRVEPGDPRDPASERYPHVYGPVPVTAVRAVRPARMRGAALEVGEPVPTGLGDQGPRG